MSRAGKAFRRVFVDGSTGFVDSAITPPNQKEEEVRFYFDETNYVDVRVDDGALCCRAYYTDAEFVVKPVVANVVELKLIPREVLS